MATKIQIPLTDYFRLTHPRNVCLITADENIITLAWTTPISLNPPLFGISVGFTRTSYKLIKEAGDFGVNVPTMDMIDKVLYCGRHSGKKINKFEKTGLTPIPATKIKAKLIKECIANFECELIDAQKYGDHGFFVGKVVAAGCEEGKYLFDQKRLQIEELDLIYHIGGDFFCSNKNKVVSPKE